VPSACDFTSHRNHRQSRASYAVNSLRYSKLVGPLRPAFFARSLSGLFTRILTFGKIALLRPFQTRTPRCEGRLAGPPHICASVKFANCSTDQMSAYFGLTGRHHTPVIHLEWLAGLVTHFNRFGKFTGHPLNFRGLLYLGPVCI